MLLSGESETTKEGSGDEKSMLVVRDFESAITIAAELNPSACQTLSSQKDRINAGAKQSG